MHGTPQRPRLSVFRSARHIYAQVIDDTCGRTLVAASSMESVVKEYFVQNSDVSKPSDVSDSQGTEASQTSEADLGGKIAVASFVGRLIGERAIEKGVKQIVFDRNGFLYHGRVRAVSDGARKAGLDF